MRILRLLAALAAFLLPVSPVWGEDAAPRVEQDGGPVERGPVTGLPMPRFVSMKAPEGFARRGPSSTHRIDWVFKRRHMPLLVTDEYGHWRRVQDREGAGGWMHYSLLSGNRTVIVEADELRLHRRPRPGAPISARRQHGVVAWLGECAEGWCRIEVDGADGWAPTPSLWGVGPDEVRD